MRVSGAAPADLWSGVERMRDAGGGSFSKEALNDMLQSRASCPQARCSPFKPNDYWQNALEGRFTIIRNPERFLQAQGAKIVGEDKLKEGFEQWLRSQSSANLLLRWRSSPPPPLVVTQVIPLHPSWIWALHGPYQGNKRWPCPADLETASLWQMQMGWPRKLERLPVHYEGVATSQPQSIMPHKSAKLGKTGAVCHPLVVTRVRGEEEPPAAGDVPMKDIGQSGPLSWSVLNYASNLKELARLDCLPHDRMFATNRFLVHFSPSEISVYRPQVELGRLVPVLNAPLKPTEGRSWKFRGLCEDHILVSETGGVQERLIVFHLQRTEPLISYTFGTESTLHGSVLLDNPPRLLSLYTPLATKLLGTTQSGEQVYYRSDTLAYLDSLKDGSGVGSYVGGLPINISGAVLRFGSEIEISWVESSEDAGDRHITARVSIPAWYHARDIRQQ